MSLSYTQIILLAMLVWWMVRDLVFISLHLKNEYQQDRLIEMNKEAFDFQKVQYLNQPTPPTVEQLAEMVAIIIRRKKLPTDPRPKD